MLFLCLLWVSLVLGGVAGYLGCRPTPRGKGFPWTRVRRDRPVWQYPQGLIRLPMAGNPFIRKDEG